MWERRIEEQVNPKHPKYGQVQYRQQGKRGNQQGINHLGKVAIYANWGCSSVSITIDILHLSYCLFKNDFG